MDLAQLRDLYRTTLLDDVVPFWERYGMDADGGINTCIADSGDVVNRDRYGWSQWRAVWVFSKLYNDVSPEPRWLELAKGICRLARAHGPMADGHWPMIYDSKAGVKQGYTSIFTDGFVIYGLVEMFKATGDDELIDLALQAFRAIEPDLNRETLPPITPYPQPPADNAMAHGLSMMFSLTYHELAELNGDEAVRVSANLHHRRVMDTFCRKDRGLLLEWIKRDGSEYPPPKGTVILPGHAIESMWFQMHIARDRGDTATMDRAVEVMRKNLEVGWDDEFGGLFYAVDADGGDKVEWFYPETKLWWVHTEALYATLLAWEHCRQDWCLEWHERLREYSYGHFPVPTFGEWYQKLDRQGHPFGKVVALPVKDFFHLPRALILLIETLDRLLAE